MPLTIYVSRFTFWIIVDLQILGNKVIIITIRKSVERDEYPADSAREWRSPTESLLRGIRNMIPEPGENPPRVRSGKGNRVKAFG
jgi:hypothetical protein